MREIVRAFIEGGGTDELLIELKKPREKVRLIVIYVGRSKDKLRLNYKIRHLAPETESEIIVGGVLMGQADKELKMEIEFARGSRGAYGEEREDVMLLSKNARNISLPTILCEEEDSKGFHGASVGRIDEEAVKYLASRGLEPEKARELLIRAKLLKTLSIIKNAKIIKNVKNQLEKVQYEYD